MRRADVRAAWRSSVDVTGQRAGDAAPSRESRSGAVAPFAQAIRATSRTRCGEARRVERLARRRRRRAPRRAAPRRSRPTCGTPSGDRNSRDVGEQVERARAASRTRAAARRSASASSWSRRARYSSSIVVDAVLRPGRAPRPPAFCVIDVTFDVEWLWSALRRADDRPSGRASSRSASRSSRTPSTPSRRARAGRAVRSRSTAGRLCGTGS